MVARNFVLAFLFTGRPTWDDGVHTGAFDGSAGTYRGNENFEVGSVRSCLDNQIYIEEGSFAVFFFCCSSSCSNWFCQEIRCTYRPL